MRSLTPLTLLLVGRSVALSAQTAAAPFCYKARPHPACSGFVSTNFGTYLTLGRDEREGTPLHAIADWGAMVNVGHREAIGVSVFASLDRLGFEVGPAIRYRHWLQAPASLEVAVGAPLLASSGDGERTTVSGLVRWSPNDWVALAARPELVQQPSYICGSASCNSAVHSRPRVSLGIEFGRVPGAVLTGLGAASTLALLLVLSAASVSD